MGESTVRVGDVMTRDVVSVTSETPLKDVAAMLVERGISPSGTSKRTNVIWVPLCQSASRYGP